MTSFLTGGLGGLNSNVRSPDTQALEGINSQKLSYANKDFTKNIAWLNQSVDTLSQFTQKLQSGVDSANQNALEQIQGFWGDLFVLFAGFEPTGIDVGDVKYVIQGLGAFLGINPDTPFPLNLIQAALHFFTTYIVPLDQFTDVIFDAILAWAADFGLPQEFIDSLHELFDAIRGLTDNFDDLFNSLGDLLGAFGFLNFTSTSGLGDLWDTVMDLISGVAVPLLKPVLQLLSTLGTPFIQILTQIVKAGSSLLDPLGSIAGGQVASLGANVAPIPSASTLLWNVGGDASGSWIFDPNLTASDSSDGSLTTLGTGVAKRVVSQKLYAATPGQKFTVGAKIRWAGIPTGTTQFGVCLVWYNGATEMSQTNVDITTGHGSNGGWISITGPDLTVPENVDGFRIGARVGTTCSTGQVWVDDITTQLQGKMSMNIIEGIFEAFLGPNSPLNALNIFGQIPQFLLGLIGIGNIGNVQPNLLTQPGFDASDSISLGANWIWDGTTGRTSPGCARVSANGTQREMDSTNIPVAEAQTLTATVWCKWAGLAYSGTTTPIRVQIHRYLSSTYVGTDVVAAPVSPITNQAAWQSLSANYTVPAGCDSIRLVFLVPTNLSAGTVWWDDAEVKKTGLIQQGWVSGLLDSLGGLGDFIQGVVDAFLSVIRGVPFVGGLLADLFEDLTGWHSDTVVAASNASAAVVGVQQTQDILVSTATNTTVTGVDDSQVTMALTSQTAAIVANAAQTQALASAGAGQANSGITAIEEFEYVNTTGVSSALWETIYNVGSSAIAYITTADGHNAGMKWAAGQTNTAVDEFLHYIGPGRTSITDYQKNSVVMGYAGEGPGFFDGRRCTQYVYGRVSSDAQRVIDGGISWVRGYVTCYGEAGIQYRVNGGPITDLGTLVRHDGVNPGAGAILSLESGYQGSVGIFRILLNGSVYASAVDASSVTKFGPQYREHGEGQGTNGLLPGGVNQYTANDNTPAAVIGSGVRIFRSSAGTWFQGGVAKLADNAFDSISNRTPDITVNLVTGGITINNTGWYLFYCRLGKSTFASNQIGAAILYKGANAIARLGQGGSATTTSSIPLDAIPVYVTSGEEYFWGHGMNSGNATLGPGDANGIEFYAGATLMNNRVVA